MNIPKLKKIESEKKYHDIVLKDEYSWVDQPDILDVLEPIKLAKAVSELKLSHVVITSVDRDDLEDGGAQHFAKCIKNIRLLDKKVTIEILTPDFQRKHNAIQIITKAMPDAKVEIKDLAGDDNHYSATITSNLFQGKTSYPSLIHIQHRGFSRLRA